MATLSEYLIEAGITQGRFAETVDVTQATISRLATGASRPGLPLAVKIEEATGGRVPAASWVSDADKLPGAAT